MIEQLHEERAEAITDQRTEKANQKTYRNDHSEQTSCRFMIVARIMIRKGWQQKITEGDCNKRRHR